jgi:hypothetical protein
MTKSNIVVGEMLGAWSIQQSADVLAQSKQFVDSPVCLLLFEEYHIVVMVV